MTTEPPADPPEIPHESKTVDEIRRERQIRHGFTISTDERRKPHDE